MAYEKTEWQNGVTPLSADNMNHIEEGIYQLNQSLTALLSGNSRPFIKQYSVHSPALNIGDAETVRVDISDLNLTKIPRVSIKTMWVLNIMIASITTTYIDVRLYNSWISNLNPSDIVEINVHYLN